MASIHSRQIEWPTVVIALGIYAGWLLVISYHESIGGFLSILFLTPFGAAAGTIVKAVSALSKLSLIVN